SGTAAICISAPLLNLHITRTHTIIAHRAINVSLKQHNLMTRSFLYAGLFSLFVLTWTSCFKGDETVEVPEEEETGLNLDSLRMPDPEGSLVIRNYSGYELVLYETSSADSLGPVKIVHNSPEDFLVELPNVGERSQVDFILCKFEDVGDSLIRADILPLTYARWAVSAETSELYAKHLYWYVPTEDQIQNEKGETGTMRFRYSLNTSLEVDIKFSEDYPPVKGIAPGDQVEISVPYSTYNLEYWYYYADPGNPQNRTWQGTTDLEVVNEDDVPIYIVLKESSPTAFKIIPAFGSGGNGGGTGSIEQGKLRIWNFRSFPLTIFIDEGVRIEEVGYREDCKTELGFNDSDISANSYEIFCLHEGDYILAAYDPMSMVVAEELVTIVGDSLVTWVVD
ncbi:MAG: hypothetical protein KDC44_18845, partial [Phaeodactylibacter sp.]|nr:hypothetical protein [Phaeodactylibacter sp.]